MMCLQQYGKPSGLSGSRYDSTKCHFVGLPDAGAIRSPRNQLANAPRKDCDRSVSQIENYSSLLMRIGSADEPHLKRQSKV